MGQSQSVALPPPVMMPNMPYKPSGRGCKVQDRAFMQFRMNQMHYCNYILEVLRAFIQKPVLTDNDVIKLLQQIKTMETAAGYKVDVNFNILSHDPTLRGPTEETTIFMEMLLYLNEVVQNLSLRGSDQIRQELERWYTKVRLARDFIADQIALACR